MKNNFILKAYCLTKDAPKRKLATDEISKEIRSKNLAWVHLDANSPKTEEWLTKECNYLDSVIIDGLIAEETRPRAVKIGDGVFVIFRCVNFNENSDPEDMVSIRMWIDQYRIISVQKRNIKSIDELEDSILAGFIPNNSGEFLCKLLDNIAENIEPILAGLDKKMDKIEETVIRNPKPVLRNNLTQIRRQAIIFRRYIAPQRDALNNFHIIDLKWINDLQKRHLQENYDHNIRYLEDLDELKERSQIIKDELSNLMSDRINKNMYMLSIISAIFLPLTFLTGLLGVNIGGIPGSDNPLAFLIFSSSLTLILIGQILLFKKLKWL